MKYKSPEMEILIFETQDVVTFSTEDANFDNQGNVLEGIGSGSETAPEGF